MHRGRADRQAREQRVSPQDRTDRPTALGLDERVVVERTVAGGHPRQPLELRRLVDRATVRGPERDLLEDDDVDVEALDERADRLDPLATDVPPPAGRERLARPDPGADVPGRETEAGPAHARAGAAAT